MKRLVLIVGLIICIIGCVASAPDSVLVHTSKSIAEVSSSFVGFTNDWWVADDPNFGHKWGNAGILTFNLSNPTTIYLVKQLSPATWRVGGSPADTVIYEVGNPPDCPRSHQGPYPLPMCLSMTRFKQITTFAQQTGVDLLFGLNGLYGRVNVKARMNTTNARELLLYAAQNKLPIHAFELSNELGNGSPKEWKVEPEPLALDFGVIRRYINEFWPDSNNRPLLVGPDVSTPDVFLTDFLKIAASFINATTYHAYAGSSRSPNIRQELIDPSYLSKANGQDAAAVQEVHQATEDPNFPVWAGEVGPAYGGGAGNITNRYQDAFWYIDHLGYLAVKGIQRFARSTLCGGDYEMLNRTTGLPNPDYFAALLWKRNMGTKVLDVTVHSDVNLKAYALCAATTGAKGSVSVVLLNFDQQNSKDVAIVPENGDYKGMDLKAAMQVQYHVRGQGGNPVADVAELLVDNGKWMPLQLNRENQLPEINGISQPLGSRVRLPALSYAFVNLPIQAAACM